MLGKELGIGERIEVVASHCVATRQIRICDSYLPDEANEHCGRKEENDVPGFSQNITDFLTPFSSFAFDFPTNAIRLFVDECLLFFHFSQASTESKRLL